MTTTKTLKYQPLQHGSNTTRILTLDAGQGDDPLTGTLEIVPIDSAGSYEAVSYVWADAVADAESASGAYEIRIRSSEGVDGNDGGVLRLTGRSICCALRRLRWPDRRRRIWADQCCINQHDLVERSHQVQFMNKIYRNATHVLVWLGSDTDKEAPAAFSLVHKLHEVLTKIGPPSDDPVFKGLEWHVRENRKALQDLTDRPWFKRGWIVQEIGTGTPATLFWGDDEIDWDRLAFVCEKLKRYHHLRSTLNITTSDISFLYRRFIEPDARTHHANRLNFVYELQRARHLRFSDDRDRVFAFLGHFSVHTLSPLGIGPVSIQADYTKSVEQTYVRVAVQILRANPNAVCILLASVQHPRNCLPSVYGIAAEEKDKNISKWLWNADTLPSWVPDWRWSEGIILAEPICPHRAHGDSETVLSLDEYSLHLGVQGLKIDTIEVCSQPWDANDFYGHKKSSQSQTLIEQLWHTVCMKGRFDLDEKYVNGKSAFFALMQTLSNGCVQAAGHSGESYHEVPDTVWLGMAATYLMETLGDFHQDDDIVSDQLRQAAAHDEYEGQHMKWSRWATSVAPGRLLARTTGGYYVLGPVAMEPGDVICVLFGAKVPFCLRPAGERFLLVGECYVHGLMNGEAMDMFDRGDLYETKFEII